MNPERTPMMLSEFKSQRGLFLSILLHTCMLCGFTGFLLLQQFTGSMNITENPLRARPHARETPQIHRTPLEVQW